MPQTKKPARRKKLMHLSEFLLEPAPPSTAPMPPPNAKPPEPSAASERKAVEPSAALFPRSTQAVPECATALASAAFDPDAPATVNSGGHGSEKGSEDDWELL